MSKCLSLVNASSNLYIELDNDFEYCKNISSICYIVYHVMATDTTYF